MEAKQKTSVLSEDLQKQREFITKIQKKGFDFGIVISEAFIRGMRDLGYKSTGTALDELIDNSIQAEATKVDVVFGYYESNKTKKKPNMIAIIDDGHGMDPEMIRISTIWGGTHREDDRQGFGRYGYGLPSACVSIGKRFQVFSKVPDGEWYQTTIDIDDIGAGKYLDKNGKVVVPDATKESPPKWIVNNNFNHGTIVIIDKIDRLDYSTAKALKDFLLKHFGLTYRNYLRSVKILVDSTQVEGIDPLFITPGLRYYDEDDDKAKAFPEMLIDIKNKKSGEQKGTIKVRFSYMPVTFLRRPEEKLKTKGKNNNRFIIRKENNGIIVLRAGRQIDVINSKCPWTTFGNNDRYLGIEIDFPPALDEEFSITTSKQQIVLKERIWDILKENGVYRAISEMRKMYKRDSKELEEKIRKMSQDGEILKPEEAMVKSKKYITEKPEPPQQQAEKRKNLEKEAGERAEKQGRKKEEVLKELESETQKYPYKTYEVNAPEGAPFYWAKQLGGQLAVYINKNHKFYSDLYKSSSSSQQVRDALKVLLYVLAECELSASEEIQHFYKAERFEWSKRLNIALKMLEQWENNENN